MTIARRYQHSRRVSTSRTRLLALLVVAAASVLFAETEVEAQFLVVDGNFGAYQSPTQFLNTRSYTMGGAQMNGMANAYNESQRSVGNPNAYFNQLRDPGFVPRADLSSRQSVVARRPPRAAQSTTSAPAEDNSRQAEMLRAVLELSSFFNRYGEFVWPKDLNVGGDLTPKRQAAEKAVMQAYREFYENKRATVASVADARKKLIEYGQQALLNVRSYSSPQVDGIAHGFLMALYDSLEQATQAPVGGQPSPGGSNARPPGSGSGS